MDGYGAAHTTEMNDSSASVGAVAMHRVRAYVRCNEGSQVCFVAGVRHANEKVHTLVAVHSCQLQRSFRQFGASGGAPTAGLPDQTQAHTHTHAHTHTASSSLRACPLRGQNDTHNTTLTDKRGKSNIIH